MVDWNQIANGLGGFSAGMQGRGQEFLQGLEDQKRRSALADLAQSNDPGAILKGMAGVDPAYLANYANYLQQQRQPKRPDTSGLPEGYMWQNGSAIPIPGINPRPAPAQSPEAKLAADFRAGLIDKETYDRAIAKQVAPGEKNYKEFQLQSAAFADRMNQAQALLAPFEGKEGGTINEGASALGKIPLAGNYLENAALTKEQQKYRNAANEWIRSKLRKESGAAIGDREMEQEYRTYFPVPGDTPEVIKQKAILRQNNTASMAKQSGGAYEDLYNKTPQASNSGGGKVLIFDAKGNIVK